MATLRLLSEPISLIVFIGRPCNKFLKLSIPFDIPPTSGRSASVLSSDLYFKRCSLICELCHKQHIFRDKGVNKVTGRGDAISAFSRGIYHVVRPRVGLAAHYALKFGSSSLRGFGN